jgi:hypothetical protein
VVSVTDPYGRISGFLEMLRIPHYLDNRLTDGDKVFSPTVLELIQHVVCVCMFRPFLCC